MKKMICLVLSVVLLGTVTVAPIQAETLVSSPVQTEEISTGKVVPVAYTSDFDGYSNVVGTLNSDGTKTAYIFASAVDTAQVDSITGLTSPVTEPEMSVYGLRPIIDTGINDSTIVDASVYSSYPTMNFGTASTLSIGKNPALGYARTYMKFDVSSLTSLGISYRDVLSACVYFEENSSQTTAVIEAYLVKSAWDENSITWTNRPDYYNGELIGNMDFSEFYSITDEDVGYGIYITKAVMAWLQGMSNYGILLKETQDRYSNNFYSDNYELTTKRPYLTVTYSGASAPLGQGIVDGEKYYIVNRKNGKCISVSGAIPSSSIYLENGRPSSTDYQQWKIRAYSSTRYIITISDYDLSLENMSADLGGEILLNDAVIGTNDLWMIQRNWNGTYRIQTGFSPYGALQLNSSGNLCQNSYTCDFDYSDEWTLYPVSQGTAAIFDFTTQPDTETDEGEIDTTYGKSVIRDELTELGYSAFRYSNYSATTGFSALKNTNYFYYNGHGNFGRLAFFNSQNVQSDLVVAGQTENSLDLLSNNALAKQRFILLSSCLTGSDLQDDNMIGRMYWLGAHNVIGRLHTTDQFYVSVFDSALLSNMLLGRSVGESTQKAMWNMYNDIVNVQNDAEIPTGKASELHALGDNYYRPWYDMSNQYLGDWYYSYKDELQLVHKTHYTGQETAAEKVVTRLDGDAIAKEFTLPCNYNEEVTYDVYSDSYNGVYWYLTGTNVLQSYEPYIGHLQLGETVVDPVEAKAVADDFLLASGYDTTGYSITTSNEFSKNYTLKFTDPDRETGNSYLTFLMQADSAGNVYIVKFNAYDYTE